MNQENMIMMIYVYTLHIILINYLLIEASPWAINLDTQIPKEHTLLLDQKKWNV